MRIGKINIRYVLGFIVIGSMIWLVIFQFMLMTDVKLLRRQLALQADMLESMGQWALQSQRSTNLVLRAQETPWITAENSPVQCRLTVESDILPKGSSVTLLAEVRNNSDREQIVKEIQLLPFDINLQHDGQPVKYLGNWPDMAPPSSVTLEPGRILRKTLTLTSLDFAELKLPGSFIAQWTYASNNISNPSADYPQTT